MKALKIIAVAGVLATGSALVLLPEIPVPFLADIITARAQADAGSRVRIGGATKLRLWPTPVLSIGDVTLVDDTEPERLRAETVRVTLSFDGLLSGRPKLTEVAVIRPVLRVSLLRQRRVASGAPSGRTEAASPRSVPVGRIVIEDGTVVLVNRQNGSEIRVDKIGLAASLLADEGRADAAGSFRCAGQVVRVELKTDGLRKWQDGQALPLGLTLAAPGSIASEVSATAELRLRNDTLLLDGVAGRYGQNGFSGWASVDFSAGKPVVKGDVDFDRLQAAAGAAAPVASAGAPASTSASAAAKSWSTQTVNLDGLNFFDAEFQASASEFGVGSLRFAPIVIAATLNGGRAVARVVQAKTYGGEASGTITVDASGATPIHAMRLQISRVGALPLLTELADFSWLEGEMEAALDLNATGASQVAIVSTLAGTADTRIVNGAVRGVDIAKLIRDVSENILTGWQQSAGARTELAELGARWRLQNGIAVTDDLQLAGPIVRVAGRGSVDLPLRTLQLKANPQLVLGVGGAAASREPIDLGVSVTVQGPWSEPRIYPDVAGILDDPDRTYARLRAIGNGLFGTSARPGSGLFGGAVRPGSGDGIDQLIKGIGDMLNIPRADQKPPAGGRR